MQRLQLDDLQGTTTKIIILNETVNVKLSKLNNLTKKYELFLCLFLAIGCVNENFRVQSICIINVWCLPFGIKQNY